MAHKREPIDLDTWHEVCRRREAGQPLEIPGEPIERHPIRQDQRVSWDDQSDWLDRWWRWQFNPLMLKLYAWALILWLFVIVMVIIVEDQN